MNDDAMQVLADLVAANGWGAVLAELAHQARDWADDPIMPPSREDRAVAGVLACGLDGLVAAGARMDASLG